MPSSLRDVIYDMEASYIHLYADMAHAEISIEECDAGVVALWSWHRCVCPLVGVGCLHVLILVADHV